MPFAQPPDYSKSVFPIAVGVAIAVVLFTLTRSTLPQVGDNIHNLPHGGNYLDGTKRISYCGPKDSFPSSSLVSSGTPIIIGVITFLIFAIYVSEKWFRSSSRRCACCIPDAPACTATLHE
uniref:Movement protein TGB2 n=1 Tax=Foveavirus mali TaxID=35350 RepID=A0A499UJ58_9VIRU|nr:triple gene block 1 protein 2 [Apple stem pitting virus]